MIPDDPNDYMHYIKIAAYWTFAAVGGFMGYLMRTIDADKTVSWGRSALEGCASGFVGLLMMMTSHALGFSEHWTGILVGVSGWLGANASIRLLEKVVSSKLGVNDHDER